MMRFAQLELVLLAALPTSSLVSATVALDAVTNCLKDSRAGLVLDETDPLFGQLRFAFSKFYENWPYLIVEALKPNLTERSFVPATEAAMELGKEAVADTVACCRQHGVKFTARSGGHNNAGASVLNGLLTIDVRGLNRIHPTFYDVPDDLDGFHQFWSPGTVTVGAGATAGQAQYTTFDTTSAIVVGDDPISRSQSAGALPVGQKPSVGMAGLTLGGGFGFQTRYAGLLCDRLVSFQAVVPATNELITVTPDGEHSDLFWAACGGGGGNFVVVTEFTYSMMPVCPFYEAPQGTSDQLYGGCHGVVELQYFVELDVDIIDFYQDWSLRMDTRITPNFEVVNQTHGVVAGIYMGPIRLFFEGLLASGITNDTPLTLEGFNASSFETNFAQAITDLSGWTDNQNASVLVDDFLNERSYFKYKSFFLTEPLPREAIEILIAINNVTTSTANSLVFEFQALGGDPAEPFDPLDSRTSPPNNFSSVDPKSTAFAHRNARHCLMLKATGDTLAQGQDFLLQMESAYAQLIPFVSSQAVYYNHMDLSLAPGDDPYFKNGVEGSEPNFWVDKLEAVRQKYNPDNLLSNLRPCCGNPIETVCASNPGDSPTGTLTDPTSEPTASPSGSTASGTVSKWLVCMSAVIGTLFTMG